MASELMYLVKEFCVFTDSLTMPIFIISANLIGLNYCFQIDGKLGSAVQAGLRLLQFLFCRLAFSKFFVLIFCSQSTTYMTFLLVDFENILYLSIKLGINCRKPFAYIFMYKRIKRELLENLCS